VHESFESFAERGFGVVAYNPCHINHLLIAAFCILQAVRYSSGVMPSDRGQRFNRPGISDFLVDGLEGCTDLWIEKRPQQCWVTGSRSRFYMSAQTLDE
jgi:hypothetical protein